MTDTAEQSFGDFPIHPDIVAALADHGITHPFPIQAMTLPVALGRHDIIGQAKTGTGKTLGFGIPLLQGVVSPRDPEWADFTHAGKPQALAVAPTRELAVQVAADLERAGKRRGIRVLTIYGGRAFEPQIDALQRGVEVVVGTPGRLIDLAKQGHLDLSRARTVVLDEAHAVKNPDGLAHEAIRGLEADNRLALSGTPIENHLGELWSLFTFINPGLLGSLSEFKRRFGKAVKDPQHMAMLRAVISPFILRRLKQQVLTELPDKTEIIHHISLSPEERQLYEATRREVVQQVQSADGRALMHVLSGLTRLRRLCCSPKLVMPEWSQTSSKLDEAMALLDEAIDGGHRVLVFSQFVDLLSLLRARIEQRQWDYCYLDGGCSAKSRQESILRFRHDPVPLFLISLKAGGTGLNLTQADTVLHLDPWWNPAVEDQASDRAHRMGQTQPVTVYRLVCEQTVEEKIVALHDEKRALADGLLSGQSEVKGLDVESLRALLMS